MGPRPPAGARGDLLIFLEGEQCVGNVSVIHPGLPGQGLPHAARQLLQRPTRAPLLGGMRTERPSIRSGLLPVRAPHSGDLRPPWQALYGLAYRRVIPG
jgi:hypothetical protein